MATTGNDRTQRPSGRDMARMPEGRASHPTSDTEDSVADDFVDDDKESVESAGNGEAGGARQYAPPPRPNPAGESAFVVYRPGQGGRVRWGSALVAGMLVIWGAVFLYERLAAISNPSIRQAAQYGIPAIFAVVAGFYAFKAVTKTPRSVDFLIATEGEMKKVNWSTRKEVTGSTIVVIVVMVFMAVLLLVVDLLLLKFFELIGVLRLPG